MFESLVGQGQDEYAATLAKVTRILGEREHLYARADLHIPLGVSPQDPGERGATPADLAYRWILQTLCLAVNRSPQRSSIFSF